MHAFYSLTRVCAAIALASASIAMTMTQTELFAGLRADHANTPCSVICFTVSIA